MSLGESRVRVKFNVSGAPLIDEVKKKSAQLINLVNDINTNGEGELARLKSLAMTDYESAASWAVKALTFKPE